jgi:DNA-binding IclR family transcriptional regulator
MTHAPPALEAAFLILELVARQPEGAGFTEILDALPQSRASVARFLKWMTEADYLAKASGKYCPGRRMALLASRIPLKNTLLEIAEPIIQRAGEALGHTCIFFSWDGKHHECLVKHMHPASIAMQVLGNVSRDLAFTPWGWMTLAVLEEKTGQSWRAFTEPERYPEEVISEQVSFCHQHGYALDDLAPHHTIRRLAVPVTGATGELIGLIGLGAIAAALPDKQLPTVAKALQTYAEEISGKLS